jgi:hypothetical protein
VPAHAGPEAVQLFSHDLLQHRAIEREIRHQAFQLGILLTELPQFAQFTEAQPRILALPHVKRLLADADLPAHVHHGRATLCFPQGGQNLFLGMPSSSCHRRVLLLGQEDHVAGRFLKLPLAYFSGFGSCLRLWRLMRIHYSYAHVYVEQLGFSGTLPPLWINVQSEYWTLLTLVGEGRIAGTTFGGAEHL